MLESEYIMMEVYIKGILRMIKLNTSEGNIN